MPSLRKGKFVNKFRANVTNHHLSVDLLTTKMKFEAYLISPKQDYVSLIKMANVKKAVPSVGMHMVKAS